MTGDVESLVLEHLGRFQATLERIERKLNEQADRFANLQDGSAAVIGHLACFSATGAVRLQAIDNVSRRLDGIERRLELTH